MLGLGGYWGWQMAIDAGWVSHDALAIVSAKDWSTGEYKSCTEANIEAMKDEPQVDCLNPGEYSEPKRFKVRFYGATFKQGLKDKASLIWRCRKNEGAYVAFTCDDQKVIAWDEKK